MPHYEKLELSLKLCRIRLLKTAVFFCIFILRLEYSMFPPLMSMEVEISFSTFLVINFFKLSRKHHAYRQPSSEFASVFLKNCRVVTPSVAEQGLINPFSFEFPFKIPRDRSISKSIKIQLHSFPFFTFLLFLSTFYFSFSSFPFEC